MANSLIVGGVAQAIARTLERVPIYNRDGRLFVDAVPLAEAAIEAAERATPTGGLVEERLRRRTHEIAEAWSKKYGEAQRELARYKRAIDKVRARLASRISPDKWDDLSWEARVTAFVVMQENAARERGANNAIKRAVQLGKQALQNARDAERFVRGLEERELERMVILGELNSLIAGLDD